MAIVADHFNFVIGVDTHAASHTLALITAGTGALGQQAQFPTSPSGLRRAVDRIQRHTHQAPTQILIDGTGSYGATFTEQLSAAGLTVAEAPDVAATTRRRRGKNDVVDAVAMAQAARSLDINELCWPPAGGDRTALRVLTAAREQTSGERTRAVNALTALLRTVALGIDARRALTTTTIAAVAAWRTRSDNATLAVCRAEAIGWRVASVPSTQNSPPTTPRYTKLSPRKRHNCSPCQVSAPSPPPPFCWPGPTLAASAPRPRSLPWPARHRYRPHQAIPPATGSTAAATDASTARSTPSRWSARATTHAPATT